MMVAGFALRRKQDLGSEERLWKIKISNIFHTGGRPWESQVSLWTTRGRQAYQSFDCQALGWCLSKGFPPRQKFDGKFPFETTIRRLPSTLQGEETLIGLQCQRKTNGTKHVSEEY